MITLALAALAIGVQNGLLGLQLNVTVHGGVDELFKSAQEERDLGCRAMPFSIKWSDLETSPGQYNIQKLKDEFGWREKFGFISYLTLQTIDTNRRTVPADLMNEAWDSPLMLRREVALLRLIAKNLPETTGALMLGNEVDGYLTAHRNEIEPYLSFLKDGRKAVHAELPNLPVGVTTMFLNLSSESSLIQRLQAPMDVVSMTYYPTLGVSMVRAPREVGKDVDDMIRFSGKRPLFLQEAGIPASPLLGSSEETQAEFVDRLFDAMEKHRSQLAAVCFFLLVDFNDKLVDDLVGYYKVGGEQFRAFLATLGLKKQDGTPRKAWGVFKRRAKAYTVKVAP